MNAGWLDWAGAVLIVGIAVLWLVLRIRRNRMRSRAPGNKSGTCAAGCADCPYAQGCKPP